MAIDRSFIVQGHGTIVTGSVTSGRLRAGEEVEWQPRGERVRVRSLQNHDRSVDEVHRGQRAAINLAGVHHEEVARGQELAAPGYLIPARVLTVRLHCLAEARKPIKHRASVRFHIGTSELMGSVALLDCDAVQPGAWALAQVFLEEPGTATWGQPFVIRGPSATNTLGGGQVLQPIARKIRRRHVEILERIDKLWSGNEEERALAVAWFGGFSGFTTSGLTRGANISLERAGPLIEALVESGQVTRIAIGSGRHVLLHSDLLRELDQRVLATLSRLHEEFPLMATHDRQKVQAQLDYVGDDALVHAAVDRLIEKKQLTGDLRRIARADHRPKLSGSLRKLKEKMIAAYQDGRFQPPDSSSFIGQAGGNASSMADLFELCVAEGFLVPIADGLYLDRDAELEMRRLVRDRLASKASLTVAEIRDLLGTTRKFAVPLCEYLDRIGLTRRDGDLRVLAS
jgi:selenocysteine-specific elongation factor